MRKWAMRIICYLKAVWDLIRHGVWIPHVFCDSYEKAIIIATDHGFRVSDGYQHNPGEQVYKDAWLIRSKCIYCGKEELSWMRNGSRKAAEIKREERKNAEERI